MINLLTHQGEQGSDDYISDSDDLPSVSLSQCCIEVAASLGIGEKQLKSWVAEYFDCKEIVNPTRKGVIKHYTDTANFSKAYVLETCAFVNERRRSGLTVDYGTIMDHLKGNTRVHIALDIESCPPASFSENVLKYACSKLGLFGWTKITKVGKKTKQQTPEIIRQLK